MEKAKKDLIIEKFEKKKIRTFYDVPTDLVNDKDIIALQRQFKHRLSDLRGYDIINNNFFVREKIAVWKEGKKYSYNDNTTTFSTFDEYYDFLDGEIYENACYYQFSFTDELIDKYKIDLERLKYTIKLDVTVDKIKAGVADRRRDYLEAKQKLKERKAWIEKFNEATTYDEFAAVERAYYKKHSYHDLGFYLWNYISKHKENSFEIVLKHLESNDLFDAKLAYAMCFLFGANKVASNFRYTKGSKSVNSKRNCKLRKIASQVENGNFTRKTKAFFDNKIGYCCVKTDIYDEQIIFPITSLYEYFETIEEFGERLGYDFSNCDFTNAFELPEEKISKFNENTKFPIKSESQLNKIVSSGYDKFYKRFYVNVDFYSRQTELYCSIKKSFSYFFEFISFLNYDLANSELVFCDGLANLTNVSNLNLENARVISSIKSKVGALPESHVLQIEADVCEKSECNEVETALILQSKRTELSEVEAEINDDKIYYVTDLHLEHRLNHAFCKTEEDCIYTMQKIIDNLLSEVDFDEKELLLIGGDTASTFWIFELFVKMLSDSIDPHLRVVFTLGNHEFWDFPDDDIDTVVNKYRTLLAENGMYLLQNEILCVFDEGVEPFSLEMSELRLRQARAILFGGVGFAGYNENFNANDGIYRGVISRSAEVRESEKIKKAYECLCENFPNDQVVVLTHMPFEDWCGKKERHENYIYVSGHNHRNKYYDDGVIRIYSDNQIGYSKVTPRLKYFYFSYEYDLFEDYGDGIYEITLEEYRNFYKGKKLPCNFNSCNKMYMLKKNGYYCFIHQNKSKDLSIMNGGSKRALDLKYVEYYYDSMDRVIEEQRDPFDVYSKVQRQISNEIKKFGGVGTIHGAIVDIDYYNHIYLNPYDLSTTPYHAIDMVYKIVYPDLKGLLEARSPKCYENYMLLLNSGKEDLLAKPNTSLSKKPEVYLNTDIYAASREIKKMQKLNSNILARWPQEVDRFEHQEKALNKCLNK